MMQTARKKNNEINYFLHGRIPWPMFAQQITGR